MYLLLLLFLSQLFLVLPSLPPLFSSSSVLLIHRVDASRLDLTDPRTHGICHNPFVPLLLLLLLLLILNPTAAV